MSLRRISVCLGVCAALFLGSGITGTLPRADAQHQWQVITLQPLPGHTSTYVTDVNKYEFSVGVSGQTPVYWNSNGIPTALPMGPGWTGAFPHAISDSGLIVGTKNASAPIPGRDAVAWIYGTIVPVASNADALDINEAGDIVGCIGGNAEGTVLRHPFVAHVGGTPQLLPIDSNMAGGCANSINDWGGIGGTQFEAGTSVFNQTQRDGRLWYQGSGFGFSGTPHHITSVIKVTNEGYAVALVGPLNDLKHPGSHTAVVAPGGQYTVLEPLASGSSAADISKYGIIVGFRSLPSSVRESVLWIYGTTVRLADLVSSANALRVDQGNAVAMNDALTIVGNHGAGSWLMRRGLPHSG